MQASDLNCSLLKRARADGDSKSRFSPGFRRSQRSVPDDDIEQILKERNTIDFRRYSLLEKNPISEEEHKRQISLLQQKLRTWAKEKQDLWRNHHQQTITMISEIAGELMLKTIDLYKKQAI